MTSIILVEIVDRIMPNLPPRDTRNFFFDLTDPAQKLRLKIFAKSFESLRGFKLMPKSPWVLISTKPFRYPRPLVWTKGTETRIPSRKWQRRFAENWKLPASSFTRSSQPPAPTKDGAWWSEGPSTQKNPKNHNRSRRPFQCGASPRPGFAVSLRSRPLPWRPAPQATMSVPRKARPPAKPSNCSKGPAKHLHESRNRNLNFLRGIGGVWKINANPKIGRSIGGHRPQGCGRHEGARRNCNRRRHPSPAHACRFLEKHFSRNELLLLPQAGLNWFVRSSFLLWKTAKSFFATASWTRRLFTKGCPANC